MVLGVVEERVSLKNVHLLQAFPNGILCTVMRLLTSVACQTIK